MKNIFSFIVVFLLSSSILKSETIERIEINGNKRVSNETIILYGEIDKKKDFTNSDLDRILKNLYDTNFFEDIKIQLNNKILQINIVEYPIVNQLLIVGEKSNNFKNQIRKIIQLKENRSFIKSFLVKDIEKIKTLYSSIGYNSAKVETKFKKVDDDNYDLLIQIERGEQTKISSITFVGNTNIRSRRLSDVIASEEDKFWKVITRNTNLSENLINLDIRLLNNYYKSLGYYDVKVSSNLAQIIQSGKAKLVYSIDEGKRYTINKISTNVDQVFDKNLFFPLNKSFKKYVGDYYSPFKIKNLLEELDELIEDNNLQFVEHNVQEVIGKESIEIIFNVFEGEKTLVERINIIGNNITNESVIRGELILDEGDPFTKLNLEKSIAEIKSRNIFKSVKYNLSDGSQNNLKIIDIEVEEKPTGEISAGAGIGTDGGLFAVNVKENNWLGEGKSVAFDVEIDAETLLGTISYTDPNYDFLGNSISYSITSENNDKPDQGYENSIISLGLNTSFEQYKDVRASLGLSAAYDDLRTDDTASDSLKKQSGSFSEISGLYGFTFDKRNRAFMPTSGSILNFNQILPLYAEKSSLISNLSASSYRTLSENIVGAGKLYLSSANAISDDVRLSSRRSISNKRLRGFQKNKIGPVDGNDHVGGNYAAVLNFEASLPNALPENTNTDISLFLDFGNLWGVDYDDSIDDSNKIRSSTGVIVQWMSPIGPMNFTLSQNLSKASTDKTESFSFNLGTTF